MKFSPSFSLVYLHLVHNSNVLHNHPFHLCFYKNGQNLKKSKVFDESPHNTYAVKTPSSHERFLLNNVTKIQPNNRILGGFTFLTFGGLGKFLGGNKSNLGIIPISTPNFFVANKLEILKLGAKVQVLNRLKALHKIYPGSLPEPRKNKPEQSYSQKTGKNLKSDLANVLGLKNPKTIPGFLKTLKFLNMTLVSQSYPKHYVQKLADLSLGGVKWTFQSKGCKAKHSPGTPVVCKSGLPWGRGQNILGLSQFPPIMPNPGPRNHKIILGSWTPYLNLNKVPQEFKLLETGEWGKPRAAQTRTAGHSREARKLLYASFQKQKKDSLTSFLGVSTTFYTADWLLDSLIKMLSARNANIRRVLNTTLLLTEKPLQNFRGISTSQKARVGTKQTRNILGALKLIPDHFKGVKITLSGRFSGKKGMAKSLTKTVGKIPLSTLHEKLDFAKGVVHTKNGSLGVKVWICYNS